MKLSFSFSIATLLLSSSILAQSTASLAPIVITTSHQQDIHQSHVMTKEAIQPLPASDGAGVLQSMPNISLIRKGGSSSDPLFRGLGGSRLAIQADNQFILGGCGGRMDPPTAYITPTAYDEVILTKGPQSVTQGMGLVSGAIRFVRAQPDFSEKNIQIQGFYTLGRFGREDMMFETRVGNQWGYLRANVNHSRSNNYIDGDGQEIHSFFKRENQFLQLGFTPTPHSLVALSYERGRGKAAYADRRMDGAKFDRDAWHIRLQQREITPWLQEVEFNYGVNQIDHVMDNFSLRPLYNPQYASLNNPHRKTKTTQLKARLNTDNTSTQVGIEHTSDLHRSRSGIHYQQQDYQSQQSFRHWGGFLETEWLTTEQQKWVFGIRHDKVTALYETYSTRDPAYQQRYHLTSGFVRLEQQQGKGTYFLGIGQAERAPDFWERNISETLSPERNNQIDTGYIYQNEQFRLGMSLFASRVHRFILLSQYDATNIEAVRYGGELELQYRFSPQWELSSSLAYTYGKNKTEDRPLAQTPPLEFKLALNWTNDKYSAGLLWRAVAAQTRFAKGQGNIVGKDISDSPGFGLLSLNAGWKINTNIQLQLGIDNLFNKAYAEFISKQAHHSANPYLNSQILRVQEPGRQYWLRLQVDF